MSKGIKSQFMDIHIEQDRWHTYSELALKGLLNGRPPVNDMNDYPDIAAEMADRMVLHEKKRFYEDV